MAGRFVTIKTRRARTSAQVVNRKRLAETRLCVPQKLVARVTLPISQSHLDGLNLFVAQIVQLSLNFDRAARRLEFAEMFFGLRARDLKPLRAAFAFDALPIQIRVKVAVFEGFAVGEGRVAAPLQMPANARRVSLFANALHNVALRVTDLRPAVAVQNARRHVSVNLRLNLPRRLDVNRHLTHLLYVRLNEGNLRVAQVVLAVKLTVNVAAPINVNRRAEVLQGNFRPLVGGVVLRDFKDTQHCEGEL